MNAVVEHNVALKSHFKLGWPVVGTLMIPPAGMFYLLWYLKLPNVDVGMSFAFLAVYALLFFVAQMALHANYFFMNRHVKLTVSNVGASFVYEDRNGLVAFDRMDIRKVIAHRSYALAEGRYIKYEPWADYEHVEIFLRNSGRLVITSLLLSNGEISTYFLRNADFFGWDLEVKKGLYRWAEGKVCDEKCYQNIGGGNAFTREA